MDLASKKDRSTAWTAAAYLAAAFLGGSIVVMTFYAKSWDYRQGRAVAKLDPRPTLFGESNKKAKFGESNDSFCTGDIVLMATHGHEIWRVALENAVRSSADWNYFHVAMVVVPDRGSGEEYIWEIDSGGPPHLSHLRTYVEQYQGNQTIVVRKLLRSDGLRPTASERRQLNERFFASAPELSETIAYNINFFEESIERFSRSPGKRERNRLVCSGLIAETLKRMDLCDWTKLGPNYYPLTGDFEDDTDVLDVCLKGSYKYGPETRIVVDRPKKTKKKTKPF